MTGTEGRARPGPGDDPQRSPEWSLELLADLHAGALTKRMAARLQPRVDAEPQARTVLAALDDTVADLSALSTRCPARMPDAVAQRLDAALATEVRRADRYSLHRPDPARTASVIMLAARRRLRARWIGAGALAAAVMGVVAAGVLSGVLSAGTPRAGDALGAAAVSPPAPLELSGSDLDGALNDALGVRDYGPLSRPEALRRCLDAHDVPVGAQPLGAREVILDGRRGVILVLPTARADQFRLLVVGPNCTPSNPARIADTVAPHR
ncbi:MAG: hypothetical protein ACRDS9_04040 [Pseudonocardiaceae bacterium]